MARSAPPSRPLAGGLPSVAVALAAFLVHAGTLGFGFLPIDDRLLILDRLPWLRDPSNLLAAFREGVFFGKAENFYRPLLTVSFMVDTWTGGGGAFAYHFTNVVLHAAASALVFPALQRLGATRGAAFALSLVFAVHPAFTHAVAFLPGRNDTLLACAALGAFLAFERWREAGGRGWLALHLALFLAALLLKESAVVLAPLLALRWALAAPRPRRAAPLPAVVAWAVALAAWLALVRAYGGTNVPRTPDPGAVRDLIGALLLHYGKVVAPVSQSVLPTVADGSVVPGVLAVAATLAAGAWLSVRDRRAAIFGWAWFLGFLLPPTLAGSLGAVMPIHHEHRLYLPVVGAFAALAQVRWERIPWSGRAARFALPLLVLACAWRTVARAGAYATPMAFAEHAVRESPSLAVSFKMRADLLLEAGQVERATADARHALALRPGYPGALSALARAHYRARRYRESLDAYTRAIAADPGDLEHRNNRAIVHLALGENERAIADLDQVLARDPGNARALNNRGKAHIYTARYDRAIADLSAAIARDPTDGEAFHNRAVAYYSRNEHDRAREDIERARALGIAVTPAFLEAVRRASGRPEGTSNRAQEAFDPPASGR